MNSRNIEVVSTESDDHASDSAMDGVSNCYGNRPEGSHFHSSAGGNGRDSSNSFVNEQAPRLLFDQFYKAEFRQVLALAYVLAGNQWIAEELTQDAFIAAYKQWAKISQYDSPEAWVRRVLCNRATSTIRKRVYEAKTLLKLKARAGQSWPIDEDHDEFWQMVRQLPTRQAQVIALHYLEDMSVADIAAVLNCSEGTIKTHLSRAREVLASKLKEVNSDE